MTSELPLTGCRVAVPESRQLDILTNLLERRGAQVRRCPMIAIFDSPQVETIRQWVMQFIESPPDWLILLTGEGLQRLQDFVIRHEIDKKKFLFAISQCKVLSRGPKPARVMRQLGLKPTLFADEPTTSGIIKSLDKISLDSLRISVQLYGDDPNLLLMNYLRQQDCQFNTVAPYIYAGDVEQQQVAELIYELVNHRFDVIAFTSKAQVHRLFNVAKKQELVCDLIIALNQLAVAAIGPVVADELKKHHVTASIMPKEKYFMKPLVSEIVSVVGSKHDEVSEVI